MIEKKLKYATKNSYGEPIAADFYGNNLAFICQNCGHPILAAADPSRKYKKSDGTYCINCEHSYSLKWKEDEPKTATITYEGQA